MYVFMFLYVSMSVQNNLHQSLGSVNDLEPKKLDLKTQPSPCFKHQAAVVLQGVQNFDARLPLQRIGQQQAAPWAQHRGGALDEELRFFEGSAGLDAEDEVEGILGRGRGHNCRRVQQKWIMLWHI